MSDYQLPCIPAEFVALAQRWYDGSGSMLYAIASTGGLTRGNRRPLGCETDAEWDHRLWNRLHGEICHCLDGLRGMKTRDADDIDFEFDYATFEAFCLFVAEVLERIESSLDS